MWQEKKGATWNSCRIEAGTWIEGVRSSFDGGVSKDCQGKVKNKVRSAYAIQVAENQGGHKQDEVEWKTIIEVAKIFLMMQR